jgi:hypothetical protein
MKRAGHQGWPERPQIEIIAAVKDTMREMMQEQRLNNLEARMKKLEDALAV